MNAPLYSDGYFLIWRLPGQRWQLRREGQEVEQRWIRLHEMVAYDLTIAEMEEGRGNPWT